MKDDIQIFKLALNSLMNEVSELTNKVKELTDRVILNEKSLKTELPQISDSKDTNDKDELLDSKEVRKWLKISHNTLQAIVKSGKLKQIRVNLRNIRFSRNQVEEYINSLET